ncbi:hypothetical protein FJT64_013313 [Amphibalanus amphitrite]|uniref:Uncharacterized protein n=1 Tax=Amphibalanus amphitrite TaxID=1232801 RepID=A0A6A4V578_AMPAM|nr:hypothetical protein FJT64_013313 [Amphibalanus amphitrite]KAF0288330.1 hypothetical protein FJT64_013313 [Amphibalanus amphitrite]KAF0288331.1 hypothetical protein FJT64_013313 [Amphibalanus amphitrite]KAF0288332.1 hypothetical protein FJT64_013313 [Amphibalanus amphitrite]
MDYAGLLSQKRAEESRFRSGWDPVGSPAGLSRSTLGGDSYMGGGGFMAAESAEVATPLMALLYLILRLLWRILPLLWRILPPVPLILPLLSPLILPIILPFLRLIQLMSILRLHTSSLPVREEAEREQEARKAKERGRLERQRLIEEQQKRSHDEAEAMKKAARDRRQGAQGSATVNDWGSWAA